MRILHTSDWHVGRTIRGRSRAGEHREVLAEISRIAADRNVDLTLVAGDLFDVTAPSAEAEQIVYRALGDLAEVSPVAVVAGNHDHPRRLQAVAPFLELGRVTVGSLLRPADEGGVLQLTTENGEIARIALVPFLSQRYIVRADELMALDPDEHGGTYAERARLILSSLTDGTSGSEINVVAAHLMVAGGRLGGGERFAHTIFDYVVPSQAFDGSLSYVALGHLHRSQKLPAPCPMWYSGSPLALDFSESEDQKAVLVVDVEPGLPAHVEQVPLTAGRRLVQLSGTLEEVEALVAQVDDAFLKVVLFESPRAGLADQVRELFPDAVDIELATAQTREEADDRLPRRLGRPPHDLFVEYVEQQGFDDPRVVALFDELLEEALEA